jgi:trigger factor
MQVTVEDQGKLKRRISVEVPLTDVRETYDQVYAEIRSHLRINGFRPGKFPRALADKRFRSLMAKEAIENLVPKYFDLALKEQNLRSATEPQIEIEQVDQHQPLKFAAKFEVYPPFELLPPSTFKLEDKPVDVTQEQIEERVLSLRRSRSTREDKGDAAAEAGDVVTMDFDGTLDGVAFPGGSAKGQTIELGQGQYLPEFDTGIQGMARGQTKSFDVTFPADYGEPTLAGKTVQFAVTAHQVQRTVPAEMNPEFFKKFGDLETETAFRDYVKKQIQDEQERTHMSGLQQAMAEQIREHYTFDVPESAMDNALHEYEHELAESNPEALKDAVKLEELKAERRKAIVGDLRIGFVVDTYAKQHDLQVDPQKLQERFYMQAYMMRQNPSELLKTQYGEQMLTYARRQLLTSKALGHLVHQVLGKPIPAEFAPGETDSMRVIREARGATPHEHDHGAHDHTGHDHAHHDHDVHEHGPATP